MDNLEVKRIFFPCQQKEHAVISIKQNLSFGFFVESYHEKSS